MTALHQLHYERGGSVRSFDAVDLRDVRMVQRGERLGLAVEARQALRIGGDRLGQDFDGDRSAKVRIRGAIHLAHAAFAHLVTDPVRTDLLAGLHVHGYGLDADARSFAADVHSSTTAK